ncbi:MAG: hypothetical protein ACU0BH_11320 [Paracoccaceae bacterium]|uniref:hypothetical protein n=1 Tax=Seohaeicola saemankumensis TaxID=481181 RepID=UPI001E528753|nr:hypothetical protein [Seohaeicola saemankumensis]MCD1625871.1 hypothetical protein [Seohaeicola saemankumensis]
MQRADCLPNSPQISLAAGQNQHQGAGLGRAGKCVTKMNQIIYLVGLIVIVLFILSYFGLR